MRNVSVEVYDLIIVTFDPFWGNVDCINGFILRSFYSKMKLLFKKKKKGKKKQIWLVQRCCSMALINVLD